jgi:purine nucleoside phosphorylase
MTPAVILGSSFSKTPLSIEHTPLDVDTSWGRVRLYQVQMNAHTAYLIYRHGIPHSCLPHQINFRGYIEALKLYGCTSLLLTSSVGVLRAEIPLYTPLLAHDLLMPFNRLPTGEVCTLFPSPVSNQGHLVLQDGIFSSDLNQMLSTLFKEMDIDQGPSVTFAYVPGPRTKTKAENHFWRHCGADVNSMSIGPEVVLANEAGIPTSALLIGHKYSLDHSQLDQTNPNHSHTQETIQDSLLFSRKIVEDVSLAFLHAQLNPYFKNTLYVFDEN